MTIALVRVDNRLIHGQVLELWLPRLEITDIIVVDDGVAEDPLRQTVMELAIPSQIKCFFVRTDQLKETIEKLDFINHRVMTLFSDIKDVRDALRMGAHLERINIGNIHYQKGKQRVAPCVSLNEDEICWLMEIRRRALVEIQTLPDETPSRFPECMEKGDGFKAKGVKRLKWRQRLRERFNFRRVAPKT